ncbi:ZIP family metal transporter [Inediibacterium massiliense]|uniref:ZIP family metal transporter n=1 Tax=Inediibacterium massiliense TaxID=1658111 RepID=UPI0006B62266|nr:ZIP family metal transporter [Inediibacterium massiliense]
MDKIWMITLIGTLVGVVGTGMGGFFAFLMKKPTHTFLSFVLGLSSGLMLSIVCFDLIPESIDLGNIWMSIIGILAGVGIIILFEGLIKGEKENIVKTGILVGIGVAVHNFPEGLAIGSAFVATQKLGIGLAIVIAIHNMPEGISMAAPMRVGGIHRVKAFLYTLFVGIPMGIGAFVGAYLGEISQSFIGFCLSFAGGTMLYITCDELIPKSKSLKGKNRSSVGFIIGFVLGVILTKKL